MKTRSAHTIDMRPRNVRTASQPEQPSRLKTVFMDSRGQFWQAFRSIVPSVQVHISAQGIVAFVSLFLMCVGLAFGVFRYVTTAPAFHIQSLQMQGLRNLTQEDVSRISGVRLGGNIFDVSLNDAEHRLAGSAWVAWVHAERTLPATVRLSIVEHVPSAVLVLERNYLVSDQGVVFKAVESRDSIQSLPQIRIADVERFKKDEKFRQAVLLRSIGLVRDIVAGGLDGSFGDWNVLVNPDESFVLTVGSEQTLVYLGVGPYQQKLSSIAYLRTYMKRKGMTLEYVRMDGTRNADRVAVKVRD